MKNLRPKNLRTLVPDNLVLRKSFDIQIGFKRKRNILTIFKRIKYVFPFTFFVRMITIINLKFPSIIFQLATVYIQENYSLLCITFSVSH